jgi:hypothetical protein
MNYNISIAVIYISSLILFITGLGLVSGSIMPTAGQLAFGVLFLVLGLISKSKFSPFKLLENRISALIWVVISILTAFSAYLFGDISNKVILWSSIVVGLVNLFAILISKINIEEAKN